MIQEELFDKIEIEIYMQKHVDVSVDIHDVIDTINQNPQKYKWNYIAKILNSIDDNIDKLTQEQCEMVIGYLTKKLEKFNLQEKLNEK